MCSVEKCTFLKTCTILKFSVRSQNSATFAVTDVATVFCGRQRSAPTPSVMRVPGTHEPTSGLSGWSWAFYVNGIAQGVVFCDGLLSPRITFSRFIRTLTCMRT